MPVRVADEWEPRINWQTRKGPWCVGEAKKSRTQTRRVAEMIDPNEQAILFDWGDTVMRNFPSSTGPMHTWPKVEALPGVRAALERLKPSFILGLATNAEHSDEADIRKALNRCGLADFFDYVFCFRQVGHRKPEPEFYRAVLAKLNLSATCVFMVGDSLEGDVLAANAQGIAAVWFNPESEVSKSGSAHRTIHRFEDLAKALEELGAKQR